jgi:hypothetical protein
MRFLLVCLAFLLLPLSSLLAQNPDCPDAPLTRLTIGTRAQVTPGNANNVRDMPSVSGTRIGQLQSGTQFVVLDGPVCADGFNWFQIHSEGVTGWTVEGADGQYWLQPIVVTRPTPTPEPTRGFASPFPVDNILEQGVTARVISDDRSSAGAVLLLRADAGTSAEVLGSLSVGDQVTVLDGPREADGLLWRQVETSDGKRGWVAEGFVNAPTENIDRTLLPVCPHTRDRIAIDLDRYIYTINEDGSDACIHDRLQLPPLHTFYDRSFMYIPNSMFWSPDGTQIAYVDYTNDGYNYELYMLSADGSTRRLMTRNSDVVWLDWSPDGQRLLLAQTVGGASMAQIWTMRADGSLYAALTSGGSRKTWGAWLADSESLIYVENIGEPPNQMTPTPQVYTFYTVNVVQGGLKQLYRTELDLTYAALSPDRSKLLFKGWEVVPLDNTPFYENVNYQTIVIDVDTGEVLLHAGLDEIPYGAFWLPDSSGLISFIDRIPTELAMIALDGQRTEVTLDRAIDASVLHWLPDDRMMLYDIGNNFIEHHDDSLLTVDMKTGAVTTLVEFSSAE